MPTQNHELELAREFVLDTGCNLYLTGKAGTGKTTFLSEIRRHCAKRMVVTAPTGVAAINCGGVTLHSFFQLPFGPILPGNDSGRQYRFSKQKVGIIKSLDLLVIDEVSMVRADMLDGVDAVLRRFRRSDEPFGGVQLLLIGDLHQLPPVVSDSDAQLLRRFYDCHYFFSSSALKQTELVTVELQHIYRQADQSFVDLLNRVRDNRVDETVLQTINKRLQPDISTQYPENVIMLCTHNNRADEINRSRLEKLPPQAMQFLAEVEGEFPEQGYPTESRLELKIGAQVMFIRNDSSPERRYFNGRIGKITSLSDEVIHVRCPGDKADIEVEPSTWENIEYLLDETTQEITENKIGAFIQFPLKLAWAITIHKSQGLTFERAIVDAEAAFAHGQVYVALSRLTTLEGLILGSPLPSHAIRTDPAISRFTRSHQANRATPEYLKRAKVIYEQKLLIDCYNFQRLRTLLRRLLSIPLANPSLVQTSSTTDPRQLEILIEEEICSIGDNFQRQLISLFSTDALPSEAPQIRERLLKAAGYFLDKIELRIKRPIAQLIMETDNADLSKRIKNSRQKLEEEVAAKEAGIRSCGENFSPANYLRALSGAELQLMASRKKEARTTSVTYSEADVGHPILYEKLKTWRHEKAQGENLTPFQVMHLKTLIQIAVNLPDSPAALKKIKGIGPKLTEKYGDELIAMVTAYRQKHHIEEVVLPEPGEALQEETKKSAAKGESLKVTLEMVEEGLSTDDIISRRGLARSTIEGHLVRLIQSGQLMVDKVLPQDRIDKIERTVEELRGAKLSAIKEALGDDASYNEIKMVQAHHKQLNSP